MSHLLATPRGITLAGVILAKRNSDGSFAIKGNEKSIHAQLQAAYGKAVHPQAIRYVERGCELLAKVSDQELEQAAYPFHPNPYAKTTSGNDFSDLTKGLMMFALTGLNDMENVSEGKARLLKMQASIHHDSLLKSYGLPTWAELAKDDGDDEEEDEENDEGNDDDSDDSGYSTSSGGGHYNPDEPRIPAGQPGGGQWTTAGNGTSTDSGSISADDIRTALREDFDNYDPSTQPQGTQVADSGQIMTDANLDNNAASTGTNPSGPINVVHDLPVDAVYYHTGTDDTPFWAPPAADWSAVYAAGQANSWPAFNPLEAEDALGHFGTFDFQRDISTNTFYKAYTNASNYAVGVYMNGAGSSYSGTFEAWAAYSGIKSSNAFSSDQWFWISKGWTDAASGKFAVAQ